MEVGSDSSQEGRLACLARTARVADGSPGPVETSQEVRQTAACQMRLAVHLEGKGLVHQGTHPEDRTDCHRGLQGHRKAGSRLEGTGQAEGSSAAAAGDRTHLAGCSLAEPELVVPVAHASRQL